MEKKTALNPTVIRLGLVSFFADISSEMLYPITPIFLSTVLGASMASIGLVEGVAEAMASLLKTYSGFWSDKIERRKPFIAGGYFLAAVAKPFTGLATSWVHVLFARAVDRTGKGIRTAPRDALLADATAPEERGAAYGWHRGMDSLGAALGPLLAIVYLSYYGDHLRQIYFWALVPGLLAVALVFSLHEKKAPVKKSASAPWHWNTLPKEFKFYLFTWTIFCLTNSSDVFLLLKAKQIGFGLRTLILVYCLYNLFYALASPMLGKLSDLYGRKKVLFLGLFLFALVYLGFAFARLHWQIWLLFSLYGFYMAASDGVGKALAVDLLGKSGKASGLGIMGTANGLATIVASVLAGILWDHYGAMATFVFGASGAIVALPLLFFIHSPALDDRRG